MAIDLKHMVKVYNYVNDEKRPKVNLKFLSLFIAFGVALIALVVFAVHVQLPERQSNDANAASQTDYVGLSPNQPASPGSAQLAEAELAEWKAAHPDAQIESIEPVYRNGQVIGYDVTYRE